MEGSTSGSAGLQVALISYPNIQPLCSGDNEQAFNILLDTCISTVVEGFPLWYHMGQSITWILEHGNDSISDVVKKIYYSDSFQVGQRQSRTKAISLSALTQRVVKARNSYIVARDLKDDVIITQFTPQIAFIQIYSLAIMCDVTHDYIFKKAGGKQGSLPKLSSLVSLKHVEQQRIAGASFIPLFYFIIFVSLFLSV
jgi:hypothetical protein